MNKKFFSFLATFFFVVCLFSIPANADLGNMLNQLEKMGKKLDSLGEKKIPALPRSGSSFKKELHNRSLYLTWYLKRPGKEDGRITQQYLYFKKNGKMWGLFYSKKNKRKYDYAVSGKWTENNGRVCIEHVAMYAVPSSNLIVKPARKYCYNFPKTGFSDISYGQPYRMMTGNFRVAKKKIRSFIIPKKNPDKYKKYHLVAEFGVSTKRDMTFRKAYKQANSRVSFALKRKKQGEQRVQRQNKRKQEQRRQIQKDAEAKAMQKARAKQEMSNVSSFKNARGKWGIKFGMTKRQAGAASKICKFYENKRNPKYSSISCKRELFGIMRSVPLSFRKKNGRIVVSGIQAALGKHTYAEWTKIHNMLRKKYKVNKSANASEREMYRAKTLTRYANIYDNGRIVLQVSKACEKYGGKYSNYKCLWHKDVMHLIYWDDIEARAFMALIKKRSKKEDL